ncbi:MBL fold metallo-hydrolase [Chengkuizengella axinellae]|uniref:MBL fold metallo-hydrolase n=1 Tax=Chengkuizengella axinellae TaxID=3064388 RepID=A0ABT9J5B5_9BACL|nr:MBL fold metallo-hydrolase [Chengkuizengella sp. 2205SS18-9]MDP5276673.1 MBL fold metallo-hydrolase [Chengkuizengella sp. 2205SS18-9]
MSVTVKTAKEIFDQVLNGEELFILDVRNTDDFKDWKIEGKQIKYLNVPYFDLIDGVEEIMDQIPKDKEIIVVCAKEGSSKMVAEMLSDKGLATSYLKGGMKSWSEYLYKKEVYKDDKMTVFQFVRVGKGCLSYMVVSGEEALIVDPSRFTEIYKKAAEDEDVKITHIVDSHLHADHISGGRVLAEETGANYYLMKSEGAVFDFKALENYNKIDFEQVSLEVIAIKTPGHTPGSVSFFVNDKLLFSGDTIFVSGLGRPDLGGKAREWAKDLYDTVYNKVSQITDDVIVLPSHYADFEDEVNRAGYIGETLGEIRKQNEIMSNQSIEDFVEHVAQSASSETPPNFEEIIGINRGVEKAAEEKQQELEIGPNRCAVHHTH